VYTNGVPNGRMLEESNTYCSRISPIRCHAIIKQFGMLVVYIVYTRADSRVSRLAKSGKAFKQFSMPPTRSSNALDISCDAPNAPNFRVFSDINVCVLRSKTKLPGPVGVTVVPPMMARRKHHPGIQINYPGSGNNSQFTLDPYGRVATIVETVGGTVSSTKQFVWVGDKMQPNKPSEARNASGTVTAQYFENGQTISGTNYFYTADHLDSIRDMTDSSGSIKAQYVYDSYGRVTKIQGSVSSDIQYGGYYYHAASGLSLTVNRVYSANLGRWINRDPIGERPDQNLYRYVENSPTEYVDPTGLQLAPPISPPQVAWDVVWIIYWLILQNQQHQGDQQGNQTKTSDQDATAKNSECNQKFNECNCLCSHHLTGKRSVGQNRYNRCMRLCMGDCGWPFNWIVDPATGQPYGAPFDTY
jgi:RHS repeat-associated protein